MIIKGRLIRCKQTKLKTHVTLINGKIDTKPSKTKTDWHVALSRKCMSTILI